MVAEDLNEASTAPRSWSTKQVEDDNSKKKMHTTAAQRKEAKRKAMMDALKILFEKRLQLQIQKTVVVLRNNRLCDAFDLVRKAERTRDGGYERRNRETKLSPAFQAKFVRRVNNNCFVALYDYRRGKFFFKRVEPVVSSKRKSFMILDSIFSKIVTVYREECDESHYTIFSRCLENYGQAFDALSPFLLAKQFRNFLECTRKSPLTTYLATETAHMCADEGLQHQQLVISKKFSNMARRDETILVWNKFSTERPTEILDEGNELPQLNLVNATFLNSPQLIARVRE